jgi:hypothetical protein
VHITNLLFISSERGGKRAGLPGAFDASTSKCDPEAVVGVETQGYLG